MSKHRKLSTSLMNMDTKPGTRLSAAAISEHDEGSENEEGGAGFLARETGRAWWRLDELGRDWSWRFGCFDFGCCEALDIRRSRWLTLLPLDFVYLEEEDELRIDTTHAVRNQLWT